MKIKNNLLFKILIILLSFTIIPIKIFPIIFGNGSGSGYVIGGGENYAGNSSINIEKLVVEGAGHYLNAQTDVMLFLHRLEMSVNMLELNTIVQSALNNMYLAAATYDLLIRTAEVTPYNETVIMKLKDFDYDRYMIEQGLNTSIFKEVEAYLCQGDITGMYKQIRAKIKEITGLLNLIKEDVSLFKMPPLFRVWQLNEMCYHTLIFGQYAARVFAEFGTIN